MLKATIFGDGKCNEDTIRYKLAFKLGCNLARKGISIVNGGYRGVMEASFKGASNYPVERIAIITKQYKSFICPYATQIIETDTYLERLSKLLDEGDFYVFFEGGSGTLLEMVAYIALSERSLINKKAICIGKRWNKLFEVLDKEFIMNLHTKQITIKENPDEIENELEKLLIY